MPTFWLILFLATVSQGYFLSFGLSAKAGWRNPSINVLSLLILAFTLTLTYYLTFWLGISYRLPTAASFSMQLTLLYGPLLWVYIQKVQKQAIPYLWLHFSPFVIAVISLLIFQGTDHIWNVSYGIVLLQNCQLLAYSIYMIYKVKQKPLKILVYLFSGYSLCFLTYYMLVWTFLLQVQYDYMVSFGMAIFIYFLGYKGLQTNTLIPNEKHGEKYSNSSLTENALAYIISKLDQVMEENKLYLNSDLKLQDLADKLDISIHSLSQAINSGKKQSFNDYLNALRIDEAICLMKSESHQELKLMAIALDSGFNNKTSFLNAFKKHMGQTPSKYRENLLTRTT